MTIGITRWNPRGNVLRRQFDRAYDQFARDFAWAGIDTEDVANRVWSPLVDIKESEEDLTVSVELPGVAKEDVEISLENSVLTIKGERKFETDEQKEKYHRVERAYGAFSRSFTVSSTVDASKVDASYKDGVLLVKLPKAEQSKPRKITVK